MKENVRKVRKTRINTGTYNAVKRKKVHRFARWCEQQYGTNWRGIYENFRTNIFKAWKWEGIQNCIRQFDPEFIGTPAELWASVKRNAFCEFMDTKNMSRMTTWRRFSADDWTDLELVGIRDVYSCWIKEYESVEN